MASAKKSHPIFGDARGASRSYECLARESNGKSKKIPDHVATCAARGVRRGSARRPNGPLTRTHDHALLFADRQMASAPIDMLPELAFTMPAFLNCIRRCVPLCNVGYPSFAAL
jgi:hypothetical protein